MLNVKYRLKKRNEFKKIYAKGKSVAGRLMVLYWLPCEEKQFKAGFSISKKVGNAVVRNRYKRILRACLNNYIEDLQPVNVIIIARMRITSSSYNEINKEMKYLLNKAILFNKVIKN